MTMLEADMTMLEKTQWSLRHAPGENFTIPDK